MNSYNLYKKENFSKYKKKFPELSIYKIEEIIRNNYF